jgi:hypothetical protein
VPKIVVVVEILIPNEFILPTSLCC